LRTSGEGTPEDHSNSSTGPSYGQEAHTDLGIVENWHRQSTTKWTSFSFHTTNQEYRRMSKFNHHTIVWMLK